MTPLLVDAHLHLPPSTSPDQGSFLHSHAAGIGVMALNSTAETDWQTIRDSAENCPAIIPFLGIHPWRAHQTTPGWEERLLTELNRGQSCIGEIGLDALAIASPKAQEAVFIPQLEMAEHLARPVTIHCCRRWGRFLELLSAFGKGRAPVIIHGFSGSLEVMRRLLDYGVMLSFGPSLANPARIKTRQAFQQAPLDRILLESDWPPRSQLRGDDYRTHELPRPETILADLYPLAAELKSMDLETLQTTVWNNGQIFSH